MKRRAEQGSRGGDAGGAGDTVSVAPTGRKPMPWALIDATGDTPFLLGGREQPAMPADRRVFDEESGAGG